MDEIQFLAIETINKGKQAIVFVPSRASAEKTSEDISKLVDAHHLDLESEVLRAASTPTKQCKRLSKIIRKGVAFHHAGLLQKQKDLIEEEFKQGKIKIICATPTLAAGLSLPVFRVIIKSLKRFSGRWGMDWIPVLEYLQMAGRAGRPEYEAYGESIVIAKDEAHKTEIYEKYVCGKPEEIYSKLAVEPVLRTYLLSLISSGIIRDEESMKQFFAKTFWAHQYKDMDKLEMIMDKMLDLLDGWEFVNVIGQTEKKDDFQFASSIGKKTNKLMKPTLIGKRISELYLDPLTANHLIECLKEYNAEKEVFSLLQMVAHTLEMRPLLRLKVKDDFVQEELTQRFDQLLKEEPSEFDLDYDDFLKSIKTTLFFEDWINEKNEDFLMEKFGIRPGEIRMKLESADWLLYAASELAKIEGYNELIKDIHKLRIRVKNGVKEELLPLLKLKGIGRMRARKMYMNGLKDLGDLKKIDLVSLSQILGKAVSTSIKKQLGEDVVVVPAGKLKGQLSLEKF
ncbi:hypothetical protein HOD05_01265 [Candidatus Woesearchaeota archaeon]|jgi:helicase|nr:hypothetical protein [Candidatus Woesearchaeota archaeon]MBT4151035.1 hypothetical protein [Candidatus Woesearchaeota archaeon]MBT4247587.1 hypothetical protein [Candidatus Woesearchaeota archaeon]MBT4433825.1 hypothetical protein [Candidatus Woesearchaeota archaeon]MBT7332176.1 hypothetical protein [Candidatus Woesearchaeota archaeon]